jgi:hypothetical protein
MSSQKINATEFLNGQRCYLSNKSCPANADPDFKRGYALEYERAEINTYQSINAARQQRGK